MPSGRTTKYGEAQAVTLILLKTLLKRVDSAVERRRLAGRPASAAAKRDLTRVEVRQINALFKQNADKARSYLASIDRACRPRPVSRMRVLIELIERGLSAEEQAAPRRRAKPDGPRPGPTEEAAGQQA